MRSKLSAGVTDFRVTLTGVREIVVGREVQSASLEEVLHTFAMPRLDLVLGEERKEEGRGNQRTREEIIEMDGWMDRRVYVCARVCVRVLTSVNERMSPFINHIPNQEPAASAGESG